MLLTLEEGPRHSNLTSDNLYTSNWDKDLKSILHLDGNLVTSEFQD
jgi:hypothetical protein